MYIFASRNRNMLDSFYELSFPSTVGGWSKTSYLFQSLPDLFCHSRMNVICKRKSDEIPTYN